MVLAHVQIIWSLVILYQLSDNLQYLHIRRQPLHRIQRLPGQPCRRQMFIQLHRLRLQRTHIAMHRQVKSRVVPLYGFQQLSNLNIRIQFLHDLARKRLLMRLASIDLAAGELPPAFEVAIAALGGEDLVVAENDGCYDVDGGHVVMIHCISFNGIGSFNLKSFA